MTTTDPSRASQDPRPGPVTADGPDVGGPSPGPADGGVTNPGPADVGGAPLRPSRLTAAAAGMVAALAALATGELLAGLIAGATSPLAAVGSVLIDLAPAGSKEIVVSLFGTNDKPALEVMVALVVLLIGAGLGNVARTRPTVAAAGIAGVVGVGVLAALRLPGTEVAAVLLSAALQVALAVAALAILLAAATPRSRIERGLAEAAARRRFLVQAAVLGGLAVIGGGLGRRMLETRAVEATTADTVIPPPVDPAPSIEPGWSLGVAGLGPVITPNDRFYKIDTALITPTVDLATWQLKVTGMVDHELTLSFDQLVELPLIERYVTIACVSNEVGGHLVGNAKWSGVRLSDVLDMAGVQAGATQIVPRSVDGWTAGFPTAWITDPAHPRDALIALRMNDAPLPAAHGFPARLIVPGLYGYVSATKWLSEIQLTTLEAVDAYWVPRGWAKEAPILTQSRIDVPRSGATVQAGPVAIAGVAWAPDRGISKVEVSVDDGDWQPATLATEIAPATWVQWKWTWQATPGNHRIAVRATDGTGAVQTAQATPPPPDGARGHHTIAVHVG